MKRFALFTLPLLLFVLPFSLSAQITNKGFEEWRIENGADRPAGWTGSSFGMGKDSAAYSGEYAISVWNWYFGALGMVSTGEFDLFNFGMNNAGVPIEFVPEKLTGFYKYLLGQNRSEGETREDSAGIQVVLKRYDPMTGTIDTIADVTALLPATEGWIPFSIDLPLKRSDIRPDSILVSFYSSNPGDPAFCTSESGTCCYLSVDDVALVAASGVPYDLHPLLAPVRAVPNPVLSGSVLQFDGEPGKNYRAKIYDASGRSAAEREISGSDVDLSEFALPSGAYHVSVTDVSGRPVAAGRFVVE